MVAARAVDKGIHAPELRDDFARSPFEVVTFRRVAREDEGAARPFYLREAGVGLFAVAREDSDACAAARQRPHHLAAQHSRAARDHDSAPLEVVHLRQLV